MTHLMCQSFFSGVVGMSAGLEWVEGRKDLETLSTDNS